MFLKAKFATNFLGVLGASLELTDKVRDAKACTGSFKDVGTNGTHPLPGSLNMNLGHDDPTLVTDDPAT